MPAALVNVQPPAHCTGITGAFAKPASYTCNINALTLKRRCGEKQGGLLLWQTVYTTDSELRH